MCGGGPVSKIAPRCIVIDGFNLALGALMLFMLFIQIQIQIESLHTRLDEIDEMTSAGGIPAGPFLVFLVCVR